MVIHHSDRANSSIKLKLPEKRLFSLILYHKVITEPLRSFAFMKDTTVSSCLLWFCFMFCIILIRFSICFYLHSILFLRKTSSLPSLGSFLFVVRYLTFLSLQKRVRVVNHLSGSFKLKLHLTTVLWIWLINVQVTSFSGSHLLFKNNYTLFKHHHCPSERSYFTCQGFSQVKWTDASLNFVDGSSPGYLRSPSFALPSLV